jgi:hypothetical protein
MIDLIPIEILFHVFAYLSFVDLFKVEPTCRVIQSVSLKFISDKVKFEKPQTTFTRVQFIVNTANILTLTSFTLFVDDRLLTWFKSNLDFLFKYCIIKNQYPSWYPTTWSSNHFDTLDLDISDRSLNEIVVMYGTKWSANGGVIFNSETADKLFSKMVMMMCSLKIVHPLVIKSLK